MRDVLRSRKQLEQLYPATFQAWRNMLFGRTKTEGAQVVPAWHRFPAFLRDVGPRRRMDLTLDRLDPANPLYGPGLCEWADKRTQANNRTTTVRVLDPATGELRPISDIARDHGVPADTLRRRHREGRPLLPGAGPAGAPVAPPALIEPDPDPRKRWPFAMSPATFEWWEGEYRTKRRPTETGYQWRFEFCRALLASRQRATRDEIEKARKILDDDENPTPVLIALQQRADALDAKRRATEDAFPRWAADIASYRRLQPQQ